MSSSAENIRRPSWLLQLLEMRAVPELGAYAWMYPMLHLAPRGDGHPVLVLPGFLTTGAATFPLRHFLKILGYKSHRWKLGRNLGPVGFKEFEIMHRLKELRHRYARKVSIIGWSLGGLYARELAWMAPEDVRMVITLGTPFRHHKSTAVTWQSRAPARTRVLAPVPQPISAIFNVADRSIIDILIAISVSASPPGPCRFALL